MYKSIIRPILFLLQPETIHHLVFKKLKIIFSIPGLSFLSRKIYTIKNDQLKRNVFGISFENPVGLAAGFDKDAKLFDELYNFGFGFIEIGTLTPKPQPGNEKPRMFRLPDDEALINRMGFNNLGVDDAIKRLKKRKTNVIIGGNIGKNKNTPNDDATSDYEKCFDALFDYVDYFVVNVSSPNTAGLRELQEKEPLTKLLTHLKKLNNIKNKPKPILLKIAPDLTNNQLDDIVDIVKESKIEGIIATNTTIDRNSLKTNKKEVALMGAGGISGKPLLKKSLEVISYLHQKSNGTIPIIGVGGIHSPEDANLMMKAGASLIQIYTGFIYEGPSLIKKINRSLLKQCMKEKKLGIKLN